MVKKRMMFFFSDIEEEGMFLKWERKKVSWSLSSGSCTVAAERYLAPFTSRPASHRITPALRPRPAAKAESPCPSTITEHPPHPDDLPSAIDVDALLLPELEPGPSSCR
ncbi:hypothetical protein NL676_010879 [Syzygium grande]|nr:hypothetical protein NL676_010879 [Syzygium grande]